MKVWIAEGHDGVGHTKILGVFSTQALAEEHCEKAGRWPYPFFTYTRFEIDPKEAANEQEEGNRKPDQGA